MSIQDLGALGELLAAVATLATLVYLALQIRQSNKNLEESKSAAINQSFMNINARIGGDDQTAEMFMRGREGIDNLNPVELERFRTIVSDIMNLAVYADGLEASHQIDSLHFDPVAVVGSLYVNHPGIREVIDSLEPITPRNLVERFRQSGSSFELIRHEQKDT